MRSASSEFPKLLAIAMALSSCASPSGSHLGASAVRAQSKPAESASPVAEGCHVVARHVLPRGVSIGPVIDGQIAAVRDHDGALEAVRFPPDGSGLASGDRFLEGPIAWVPQTARLVAAQGDEVVQFAFDGSPTLRTRLPAPPPQPTPTEARIHDLVPDGDRVTVLWSVAEKGAAVGAIAESTLLRDGTISPPRVFGAFDLEARNASRADVIPAPYVAQASISNGASFTLFGPPEKLMFASVDCSEIREYGRVGGLSYGLLPTPGDPLLRLELDGVHIEVPHESGPAFRGAFAVSRPRETGPVLSVAYATGTPAAAEVWAARFRHSGEFLGTPIRVATGALDPSKDVMLASRGIGDHLWIYYRDVSGTVAVDLECARETSVLPPAPAPPVSTCGCPDVPSWDEWIVAASSCYPSAPDLSFACSAETPFHRCVRGFPETVFNGPPRALLLSALQSGDADHVRGAMVFLAGRRDIASAPLILDLLRRTRLEGGWFVMSRAMSTLAALHYKPAAPVIAKLIEKEATNCMGVADIGLPALAYLGDTNTAPAILRMAKRSVTEMFADATFFADALKALEKLPHPATVPTLLDLVRGRWNIWPSFVQVGDCGGMTQLAGEPHFDMHGRWLGLSADVGRHFARTGELGGTRKLMTCAKEGTFKESEGCEAALKEMRELLHDETKRAELKNAAELTAIVAAH